MLGSNTGAFLYKFRLLPDLTLGTAYQKLMPIALSLTLL